MKKKRFALAAFCIAAAMFAFAPVASASPITVTSTGVEVLYDGTNFCPACVDSQATLFFQLIDGGTALEITLTNTGTDGTLTGVGFNTTPNIAFSDTDFGTLTGWGLGEGGLGNFEIAVGVNGIVSGLAPGASGIFTGTLTQPLREFTLDSTIVHIQGVALNGGNSIKPSGCDSSDPSCSPVPEPTTMLLLGTGLFGMAAFARRRRK